MFIALTKVVTTPLALGCETRKVTVQVFHNVAGNGSLRCWAYGKLWKARLNRSARMVDVFLLAQEISEHGKIIAISKGLCRAD